MATIASPAGTTLLKTLPIGRAMLQEIAYAAGREFELRAYAIVLGSLAFLFLLRVTGQVVVALWGPSFLPPIAEWYSGLIPYPILLPIQIVILTTQGKMVADFWTGSGITVVPRRRMGIGVCWFSYAYFLAMVLQYVITMTFFPERRWFSGTIPIFFHWVLAVYLYVFGRFHARGSSP